MSGKIVQLKKNNRPSARQFEGPSMLQRFPSKKYHPSQPQITIPNIQKLQAKPKAPNTPRHVIYLHPQPTPNPLGGSSQDL